MSSCGLVALLIASAVVLKPSPSLAIAPYDRHSTCRTHFLYREHHDWMPFANDTSDGTWRMLLDQYDYQNVLTNEFAFPRGVWTARDVDGDGRQFTQGSGGTCTYQLRSPGTFTNPSTNNWVFTQAVDYIDAIEVIVNVTVRFTGCTDRPACTNDFVILHRFDTNDPDLSEAQRTDTSNYQYFLGDEQASRIQQNANGGETTVIRRFHRPIGFNYTYFGIQDIGTFGNVIRIIMYYEVCPRRLGHLVIHPEFPLPPQGSTTPTMVMAQCVEHAHNITTLETHGYSDGECKQNASCACDVGYIMLSEDECTACPAGTYRSAQNSSCVDCPGNSTSVTAAGKCSCISGHYRADHEGIGVDCTAPPPPLFHCGASLNQKYADSVSVQWQSPPHCGGRKDCYYEIAVNGHVTLQYDPPTFNFDVLESYTVNNLKPDTTYLVSVSIHNGVSEQDPANAKLRQCCIEVKTKEGSVFMLGGITYPTNTSIMIQELGESDKDSLKCTTTLETCCQNSSQANFYYPNGSEVLSLRGGSIYRTRGNGFVSLKKGTVGEPAPLGRYHCEIPDGKGIVQNLYITLGTTEPIVMDERPLVPIKENENKTGITCPTLGHPTNGRVTHFGTSLGSPAVYSCHYGYEFVGKANVARICDRNGSWSGEAPVCERVVSCSQLSNPTNGLVTITPNWPWGSPIIPGATAVYTCDVNYRLLGSHLRTCQVNATWSDNEPTCEDITCPTLGHPTNGRVTHFGTSPGSPAVYSCNYGYEFVGKASVARICDKNGSWSGEAPVCERVKSCSQLSNPTHGLVTITPNWPWGSPIMPGSTAVYTCDVNYRLIGSYIRMCRENATWSDDEPTCEAITCPVLDAPDNGIVTHFGHTVGSVALYHCNAAGQKSLVGESHIRVCGKDGVWSGQQPHCELPPLCSPLSHPDGGMVTTPVDITEGTVVTYHCNEGLTLFGNATRTCQSNGAWSGEEPTCISPPTLPPCPPLGHPDGGMVTTPGSLTQGTVATYHCNEGLTLLGTAIRTCQSNGTWSGEEPTCTSQPPARCARTTTLSGSFVEIIVKLGEVNCFTCLQALSWTATNENSLNIPISSISPLLIGGVTVVEVEDDYLILPYPGAYVLPGHDGRRNIICTDISGSVYEARLTSPELTAPLFFVGTFNEFTPMVIDCINTVPSEIGSVQIFNPAREAVGFLSYTVPNVTREFAGIYSCVVFSELSNATRTTTAEVIIQYAPELTPANTSSHQILLSSVLQLTCGYVGVPSPYLQWLHNGNFLDADNTAGVTFLESDNTFSIVIDAMDKDSDGTYACRATNALGSDEFVYTVLIEVPPLCSTLSHPDGGIVTTPGDITLGTVATYHCSEGLMLLGNATRTCQSNGVWSGEEPTCISPPTPPPCPPLGHPDGGMVTTPVDITEDTVATYHCNEGLLLLGNTTRTCQSSGAWSGEEPTCISPIHFELKGQIYLNGSSLSLSLIEEGDDALLCKTDGACCTPPNRAGEFYYPNDSQVKILNSGDDIYRNRGVGMVRLNRRNNAASPTGIYRCEIPNSQGAFENIYITLY